MTGSLVVLITLAILTIVVAISGIKLVSQGEAAIVERLGKFRIELKPGLNFIVPFLDKVREVRNVNVNWSDVWQNRIDLREQIMDIPEQEIISKDNIRVQVDTIVFYQIVEPYKAVYEISSPVEAIKQLSQTTIRNILGELDLDASLTARESINGRLR
jgi:regulator of protease activity HflC (stomatin/prohibitin superfamily)